MCCRRQRRSAAVPGEGSSGDHSHARTPIRRYAAANRTFITRLYWELCILGKAVRSRLVGDPILSGARIGSCDTCFSDGAKNKLDGQSAGKKRWGYEGGVGQLPLIPAMAGANSLTLPHSSPRPHFALPRAIIHLH